MYIELVINSSNYTVQRKDEAGTNIGSAIVYSNITYRLDNTIDDYNIELAEARGNALPYASFPKNRTILTTT